MIEYLYFPLSSLPWDCPHYLFMPAPEVNALTQNARPILGHVLVCNDERLYKDRPNLVNRHQESHGRHLHRECKHGGVSRTVTLTHC